MFQPDLASTDDGDGEQPKDGAQSAVDAAQELKEGQVKSLTAAEADNKAVLATIDYLVVATRVYHKILTLFQNARAQSLRLRQTFYFWPLSGRSC